MCSIFTPVMKDRMRAMAILTPSFIINRDLVMTVTVLRRYQIHRTTIEKLWAQVITNRFKISDRWHLSRMSTMSTFPISSSNSDLLIQDNAHCIFPTTMQRTSILFFQTSLDVPTYCQYPGNSVRLIADLLLDLLTHRHFAKPQL